jgi:hypothetical protein
VVITCRVVDLQGFWEYGALNVEGVFGVLFDVVEEEALDPALMQDDLLEAR